MNRLLRGVGWAVAVVVLAVTAVIFLRSASDRSAPAQTGVPSMLVGSSEAVAPVQPDPVQPAPVQAAPVVPAPPVVPVQPVRVTYEVTGPGAATMSYTDGGSRRVDMPAMALPWRHDEAAEPSFMAAAVSGASADPHVRLGCRIYLDGRKVAGMTGLGHVTCTQGD